MKITRKQLQRLIQEAIRQNEPGYHRQYPSERTVKYSAFVLDDASHQTLIDIANQLVPGFQQWKPVAHHMTMISPIMQGKFSRLPERFIGQSASVVVTGVVMDNRVAAAVVDLSQSPDLFYMDGPVYPHVTLGINKSGHGGNKKNNASMSNQLNPANMIPIQPVVITGVIEEIQ